MDIGREHRTSNNQPPDPKPDCHGVQHWMLDVGCWMLDVFRPTTRVKMISVPANTGKASQPLVIFDVPHHHEFAPLVSRVRKPYDLSQKIQPACRPMEKYKLPVRW